MSKIIRLPDVISKTGLSRSTIYVFIKENQFPNSIKLGVRSVGWLEESIDHWIESRESNTQNHITSGSSQDV